VMTRIAHVTVPAPSQIRIDGPEWVFRSVFGDGHVRLIGVPESANTPATVALLVTEDREPATDALSYVSPADARQLAGAFLAAAEYAENPNDQPTAAPHHTNDPGSAVHPAKNEPAGPGLPERSPDHSPGRNPMVRTTSDVLARAARRLTRRDPGDRVSYTPRELNRLISGVTAREVAGRLRERAAWHREAAAVVRTAHPDVAAWHRDEAIALDELATDELRGQEG